jgi:two-component system, OmpR family, response regulator
MKLLVAEDDSILRDGMVRALAQSGYDVVGTDNGSETDRQLAEQEYDLLILDLGLPGMDGLEVLRRLRVHNRSLPVLIITARDSINDRVAGLDLGADDYLTKPFDLAEFEARVRALGRRSQGSHSNQISIGELRLDLFGKRVYLSNKVLELSAREFEVLEVLMLGAGRVISKDQLADKLGSGDDELGSNAIEVYVHRLRKKLEQSNISVKTIRGLGYLMEK